VLHGLAGHDGPVEIRLEVCSDADRLIMRIVNTTANLAVTAGENIGLGNIRERLAVQFGSQASLSAHRAGTGAWVAEISMPALLEHAPATRAGNTS
jgi:LytS/YehU family sensor histidine kinase